MTSILRPNPAAFDGHWYTPAQMARLAGVGTQYLGRLDLAGAFPWDAVRRTKGGHRRYDAGKVLASQQRGWRP